MRKLEQAQAKARNATANYDRVRALYENRNASLNDLDSARSAYESADAAVRSIEKRLELAGLQLSYTRLTAPADGAIASVKAEVNENIRAGQEVVLLTSGSKLEVSVAIPEVLIAQIEEGDKCMVTFDVVPEKEFYAVVSEAGFGLIHRKPVVVGEITSKGIEIVQGLNDGDLVVTAGISRIHDGLRVKLLESMGE